MNNIMKIDTLEMDAEKHLKNSDFTLALNSVNHALTHYPDNTKLTKLRAEIFFKSDDFVRSAVDAAFVLEKEHNDPWIWEIRILSLIFLEELDVAKQENDNAFILFPNHLTFKFIDTKISYLAGDIDKALSQLTSLLSDFGDVADTHNLATEIYIAIKDFTKAKYHLLKSHELDVENIRVLNDLGWLYFGEKDNIKALETFLKSAKLQSNQLEAYLGAGHCSFELGKYESAWQRCEQALNFYDQDVRVWKLMLMIAHQLDDKERSKKPVEMIKKLGGF